MAEEASTARQLPHAFVPFFARFGSLRPVQLETIPRILGGENVFITAPTGSGKTEAVVAPLAERALAVQDSVYALYICPTRALINDLQSRIEGCLAQMDLRVAVQHGERKTLHYRRVPSFVLTTPESLDVLLSSRNSATTARLATVRAVVIDEVHQLYGTPRGSHLRVLLERLKQVTGKPLQRICLSATVADPGQVGAWFQGSDGPFVPVAVPGSRQLRVQLDLPAAESQQAYHKGVSVAGLVTQILSEHPKVLLFANTRTECDWLYWRLHAQLSVPTFLHYSSLDKDYREQTEDAFKRLPRALCIATSTLELGIDIGDIDAVVMYGAPGSISSFVQRLGRGNRRATTSVVYGICRPFHVNQRPSDPEEDLVYFVSLVAALAHGELERKTAPMYFSVLAQQFMTLAYRYGCVAPDALAPALAWYGLPEPRLGVLEEIARSLEEHGFLRRDARAGLYYPADKLERLFALGQVWSNIASQQQTSVMEERRAVAEVPQQYARTLSPGRVIMLAGRPRLVSRVKGNSVWTVPMDSEHAELPVYFSIAQPTPLELAAKLREVVTTLDLGTLPINYDDWSLETLGRWRRKFRDVDTEHSMAAERADGGAVYYTFVGSAANRLLAQAIKDQLGVGGEADAWRLRVKSPLPGLRGLRLSAPYLRRLVETHLREYRKAADPPPHAAFLPRRLMADEIVSWVETDAVSERLSAICSLPVHWLQP